MKIINDQSEDLLESIRFGTPLDLVKGHQNWDIDGRPLPAWD